MIQIITLIINLVNYYLMTATNKRFLISGSRGDLNWCTPCREKPDQHDTYASHSSPRTPDVCFLRAVPIRDNLSLAPMKSKQAPTPGRSLGYQRQTGPAVVLGDLISPPMQQPWSRGEKFRPNGIQLHQLTGLITPACDRYVQYLLTGANRTILNRHRQKLQPWRCRLATYPLPDLSNQLSPLSPNGPARSPV
jgi:hypothetical protein